MIKAEHISSLIVKTLEELEEETEGKIPYTEESLDLLMMTAAHESNLGYYLKQEGGGPALGPFQMEPTTHKDHWDYIVPRNWLYMALSSMELSMQRADDMEWNLRYAIVMARIHYYRKPEALPRKRRFPNKVSNDNYLDELGQYCKQHYNTALGKATAEAYVRDYKKYVETS